MTEEEKMAIEYEFCDFVIKAGEKEEPFCHIPYSECGYCDCENADACLYCEYAFAAFDKYREA